MARRIYNAGKIRCDVCGAWIVKTRPNQKRCGAGGTGISECQKIAEAIAAEMRKDREVKPKKRNRKREYIKIFRAGTDTGTNRQWRRCLKCGRKFKSRNEFNRICKACTGLNEQVCCNAHRVNCETERV